MKKSNLVKNWIKRVRTERRRLRCKTANVQKISIRNDGFIPENKKHLFKLSIFAHEIQ